MHRSDYSDKKLIKYLSSFDHVYLWGLRDSHISHKYIFLAYCNVFERFGIPFCWVDDADPNVEVAQNDLVLIYGNACNLDKVVKGNPYIIDFHVDETSPKYDTLKPEVAAALTETDKRVADKEHVGVTEEEADIVFDVFSKYSKERRTLAQPWGTDRHPDDFAPPSVNFTSSDVVFNGTVWKSHWGNKEEIDALQATCSKLGLDLHLIANARGRQNSILIHNARFAPTIAGRGQAKAGYLACRFFKNISYGQYCFCNVPAAKQILCDDFVFVEDPLSTEEAVLQILSMSRKQIEEGVLSQQEKVKEYTIFHHLYLSLGLLLEGV